MHEIVRLTRFDAAGSVLGEEQHTQDGNGNRIQEVELRLFWDSFDRLVRVERTSDGVVVGRYRYDALGRRVDRSFVAQGEVASQQVFHVHDGAREVEELDASGNVLADFVWGGMYVDELVQLRRGGQTWYAHSSSIYSVAALSDAAGNAVERYAYQSIYGVCQVQDGAGAPRAPSADVGNPWRFQGRRFDPETGFYHFRARHLDPARGRFVSRDPLGLWGDPGQMGNAYAFVGGNPVNRGDPSGLYWKEWWEEIPWYGKPFALVGSGFAFVATSIINNAGDNGAPSAPLGPRVPAQPMAQVPGVGGTSDEWTALGGAYALEATPQNVAETRVRRWPLPRPQISLSRRSRLPVQPQVPWAGFARALPWRQAEQLSLRAAPWLLAPNLLSPVALHRHCPTLAGPSQDAPAGGRGAGRDSPQTPSSLSRSPMDLNC